MNGVGPRTLIRVKLPVPLRRLGFRVAYAALRVYWFIRRPQLSGVKCLLTDGDQVLLVRHTYGPRGWDLPGGAIKRTESPADAARREMNEELGVSIDDWQALGEFVLTIDRREDRIHCFQAELPNRELEIDRGELAAASWFPQHELPTELGRYARQILARIPS
jgi:8-oxo-dGTP pyrophosphatase MutT (NUDIX family)